MKLKDLLERRSRTVAAMREITSNPAGQGGDLSDDQVKKFDELRTQLETVEGQISRAQVLDEAERRMAGQPVTGTGDDRFDTEVRQFSLVRAIAGAAGLSGVDAGREREISAELVRRAGIPFQGIAIPMQVFEQRVITTAAPGAGPGSNLVATDHLGNQYIDLLRKKLIVRRLGARVLNGLIGNVDIPAGKASATAAWIAENGGLSAADLQFRKVSMAPKHCGALTEYSRNMLMQTSPDIEQLVRADFAAVLAEAVDSVAIQGGGSNEPDGILETSGIGSVSMSGGPTWSTVLQLIEAVEIDDAEGTGWATNPKAVRKMRSTVRVSSTDSTMIMEKPNELAGYRLESSNVVPANLTDGASPEALDRSALIFGNWSDLILGYWSVLDILVNPFESTAYTKGNVQVRGLLSMDVAVRHAESFAAAVDLDTAA